MRKLLFVMPIALLMQGCLAKTAVDVVTLPVKAVGQTADWATTSQDEADRNAGRKMRKEQAKRAKAQKECLKRAQKEGYDASYCNGYSDRGY